MFLLPSLVFLTSLAQKTSHGRLLLYMTVYKVTGRRIGFNLSRSIHWQL